MSKGVLEYVGFQFDQRANMEKPHFKKKDGSGVWGLGAGPVNWQQFQPPCKLFVEWENWNVVSATTEIPERSGKGNWKSQPYHPETFVSNVVGSAIQAGAITQPSELRGWAAEALKIVKGIQNQAPKPAPQMDSQPVVQQPAQQPSQQAAAPDFDDDIPF